MMRFAVPGARLTRGFLAAALLVAGATAGVAQDAKPDPALQAKGKAVFDHWCAACHGPGDGGKDFLTGMLVPRLPGTNALYAKYKGEVPPLLEERTDLTPDLIEYFVRHGVSIMPIFRKTEVGDEDLTALSAYLTRNNTD